VCCAQRPIAPPPPKQGAHTLNNTVLPAITQKKDGSYCILARIENNQYLIHDLREPQPLLLSAEDYAQQFKEAVLLFTRRRNFTESLQQQFDIRWFIPALLKYKKLFGEVLIASFFLQLFALVTPLFFQVVMDKVIVHHGLSTLNVLALGFLVVMVFEALLGGIRTYLFAHTSNRVDVELGASLYRHLLSLPLAYFQARAVGQSVARCASWTLFAILLPAVR
jgi:subfamily B ATP-binding cassette protein HlyB/CyaB